MPKLIKRYQFGGGTSNAGSTQFKTSLGGGSSWSTSSYSNPYQYKGLSTSFQNKAASSNLSSLKMSSGVSSGGSSGGSGGGGGGVGGDTGGGGGGGLFQGAGGWGQGLSMISDIGGAFIPKKKQAALTEGLDSAYDMASNAVMMMGPYGMLIGGIMKAGGLLSDGLTALGVGTDGVTTADQILDSKFLKLTPVGLANAIGAQKISKQIGGQEVDDAIAMSGGGYGGTMSDWEDAGKVAGKKVGLFNNRLKLNKKVWEANSQMQFLKQVMNKKRDQDTLTAQMEDRWNQHTENLMNGGVGNIMFGRLGLKIEILPKVHEILNRPKVIDILTEWEEEISEFKEGGKMNVIPEGALHARLHHMENAEGLTKKGIPVVSIAEGGELEQQAEIELNEIIFNLEVTQKLEKLMEDGSDNAAIEAGKLLVQEIFENTDDRTGLIDKLTGGELSPEEAVKNHQVFQEGGTLPNLNSIEDLVDLAIKQNPQFVQRIGDDMGYAEFTDENGKIQRGTHLLGYAEDNGEYLVFPSIQKENGQLKYEKDWKKALDKAKKAGNVVRFRNESDAEKFTKEYKKSRQWKHYFDRWEQRFGSYKYGGIIEKLDTLSEEELQDLRKYLKLEEA